MDDDFGRLPGLAFGTLFLFHFVWAAMHDLSHGDEGTLEWTVLAVCAAGFPLLYWQALRLSRRGGRLAWLIGTGLILALFGAGAVSAIVQPKFPKDPMLAWTYLAAGVPALATIGYGILRETARRS
jgi:hypothetical protein